MSCIDFELSRLYFNLRRSALPNTETRMDKKLSLTVRLTIGVFMLTVVLFVVVVIDLIVAVPDPATSTPVISSTLLQQESNHREGRSLKPIAALATGSTRN